MTSNMDLSPSESQQLISRLRHIMELNHLSQARLARRLGIDPSNISKYLTGRHPAGDSLINRVAVNLGVSAEWLRTGAGVPYEKGSPAHVEIAHPVEIAAATDGIPVYDIDVAAGCTEMSRAFTRENVIGKLNFPHLNPDWVVVRAKGDSMVPVINNGGYVAFLPVSDTDNILWGQIYVVVLDNRRVVKYVRRHPDAGKIVLRSANSSYDDMDVNLSDVYGMFVVERIINIQDCF